MEKRSFTQQFEILKHLVPAYFQTHFTQIPTLSLHASKMLSLAERAMTSDKGELAIVIRSDPAITAEILRVANSTMYRRNNAVQSLDEAIVRLGRREVYAIVAAQTTRSLFEPQLRKLYLLLPQYWYRLHHHAVVCGFGAAWLANKLNAGSYEYAFLGGMFHDIGKLAVMYCTGGLIIDEQIDFEVSYSVVCKIMEDMHVEFGQTMLTNWRLPDHVINLCAKHHTDIAEQDPISPMLHSIRIVSDLNTLRVNAYIPPTLDAQLRTSLGMLGLQDNQLRTLATRLQDIVQYVNELLGKLPEKPSSRT